jgi:hypothetical protein
MCRAFSCIITKNQTIYTHPNPLEHSHTEIMNHFNLRESYKDPRFNSFVKIETYPKDNKSMITTPIDEWDIIVDETCIPSWYEEDRDSFEAIIRKEASSWLNKLKAIDWNKKTPEQCYYIALNVLKGSLCEKGEKNIDTDSRYSYFYARDVLKGPFPLGEKTIATNYVYSYFYALDVLKRPFLLGEKNIAKVGYYSYLYAKDVLKGPFKLGEEAIAKDADYSCWYAKDILKGPFPLGEKTICKSPYGIDYLTVLKPKITKQDVKKVNNYLKKNKKRIIKEQVDNVRGLLPYMSCSVIAKLLCK